LSNTGPRRTAVLGLGNPVVSDDRVGLAVAEEVRRLLGESPVAGVEVLESTRGGFELIDLLSGFSDAVIIDCLTVPDPSPGRVRRLTLENVSGSARLINAHEISIGEAFELARRMGIEMPRTVEIFAVEGGDTGTMAEELTPPVAAAVGPLARQIHALLAGKDRACPAPTAKPEPSGQSPRG
jgi:hydrogenase maturation protease